MTDLGIESNVVKTFESPDLQGKSVCQNSIKLKSNKN